jgi:hypothetical protein
MQRLTSIHPSDLAKFPNGRGTISLPASNAGTKVVMYNETPLNIDLDFLNGASDVLHAWEANYWTLDGNVDEIDWNIDVDSLNVSNPPINAVFLTLYQPGETLRDKTYPMPLIRQLGGPAQLTSSNSLVNTGNPSGTSVVNVNDPTGTTWTMTNDGLMTLATLVAGALVQILKTNATDPLLQLGAAAHLVEILGNLTVDGNLTATSLTNNIHATSAEKATDSAGNNLVSFTLGGAADHAVLTPIPLGGMYILDSNGAIHFAFDTGSGNSFLESAGAGSSILIQPNGGTQITITTSLTTISNALALLSTLTMNNNTAIKSKDSGGTARNMLSMDATNKTHVGSGAVGAEVRFDDSAGTQMGWFNSGGGGNVNGTFKSPTLGLTIGGGGNFAGLAGTLSRFTFFTGSGSGTYSHSQGVTPQWVAAIANVAGSFTQGFDSGTSTQVHITCGAALAFTACVLNS